MGTATLKITKDELIDKLGLISLILISARDCLVRLLPVIPWNSVLVLSFLVFIIVALTMKQKRINYRSILIILVAYFVVTISYIVGTRLQREYIRDTFFDIFRFVALWLYLIIFSTLNESKKMLKWLLPVAYCNLFLLIIVTLSGLYSSKIRSINYLGLGINGMIWVAFIIQKTVEKDCKYRIVHIISAIAFSIFLLVYGNRGAVVAIAAFVIFCLLKYINLKHKFLLCALIAAVAGILYYYQQIILGAIINFVAKFGITSRNLTLFLSGDISYTTHRVDVIWIDCLNYIKNNWITGYGLCFDRVIGGDILEYAHNFFLEVWLSFGLIVGSILLLIHLSIGIKMITRPAEDDWMKLFAPFYITSTIVLLFNSSFCVLAPFWASYGIYFAFLKNGRGTKKRLKWRVD